MAPSIEHVGRMCLEDILDANEYIDVAEDCENVARAAHQEASKDPKKAANFANVPIRPLEDPKEAALAEAETMKLLKMAMGAMTEDEIGAEDPQLLELLMNPQGASRG